MCRFSAFAANWSTIRACRKSSRPNEALDTFSHGRSNGFESLKWTRLCLPFWIRTYACTTLDCCRPKPFPRIRLRLEAREAAPDVWHVALRRSTPHRPSLPNKKHFILCLGKSRHGCERSVRPKHAHRSARRGACLIRRRLLGGPLDRVAHAQLVSRSASDQWPSLSKTLCWGRLPHCLGPLARYRRNAISNS